jgi:4-amino-4-deoxy-L-arabinose transferase-like glycosyltransferase
MNIKKDQLPIYISVLLVFIFYAYDIGNVDAIRQGTEGFYLQVSKEMFEMKSFLVPKYNGEDHWSKPPFQFWLSHIGYFITGGPSIFVSRLMIVLFSVYTIFLTSKKVSIEISKSLLKVFIFIAATFGMFKYSRIYMMEMPLTMLTTLSSIYFYSYLKKEKKSLLYASLFLALSILVKGPVSFVMAVGGSGLYLLLDNYLNGFKFENYKRILIWSISGLTLGSIWFFICYLQYGSEFFDYFFLRENMGKFQAKPYPIRHVFQGLLIFSLPWSLYLPTTISQVKDHFPKIKEDKFLLFCFCNFMMFFTLWLIPSQRSHHYAMPSIIFFLVINFILLNNYEFSEKRRKMIKLANLTLSFLMLLTATVFASLLLFNEVNSSFSLSTKVILTVLLLIIGSIFFIRSKKRLSQYVISFFIIGNIWNIFIPSFILPYLPKTVITKISDKKVGALVRKPYFIEEALERKIDWIGYNSANQYIMEHNHYYIMHKESYENLQAKKLTNVVTTWKIWKRGAKAKDIINALKSKNIEQLKDTVYLLENKPLK